MFTLQAQQELHIDGDIWQVVQHPGAPGMAYGQEGRAAVVYQLCNKVHRYTEPVLLLGPGGAVYEVPVDGSTVTLGRAQGNDVLLTEVAVSRQHGALVVKDGQLHAWDNSSRNGTFLDGNKIEPQQWVPVSPGSRLLLGTPEDGAPLAVRPCASACRALKVFKSRFRVPRLVDLSARLAAFADIPGLGVCTRTVFTPQNHRALLTAEPELIYGVLMPWVEGRSWMELVMERHLFTPALALRAAASLVDVLVRMEQRGLAHCDLSGPNVSVEQSASGRLQIHLVDVEQLFTPGLSRPEEIFAGSPGYAHKNLDDAAWSAHSDRFAGAILLCEMLAWCDPAMAEAAWSESYFDPAEMQAPCSRAKLLRDFLAERWGASVARFFDRAWNSDTLEQCPTFGEWQLALPQSPGLETGSRGHHLETVPPVSKAAVTPTGPISTQTAEKVRPTGLELAPPSGPLPIKAAETPHAHGIYLGPVGAAGHVEIVEPPRPPELESAQHHVAPETLSPTEMQAKSEAAASVLMEKARQLEESGDLAGAVQAYNAARFIAGAESKTGQELGLIIRELEQQPARSAPPPPQSTPSGRIQADPALLERVRALEGAPGLAPQAPPPPPPKKASQTLGYILITIMSMLLLAFLVHYKPWLH